MANGPSTARTSTPRRWSGPPTLATAATTICCATTPNARYGRSTPLRRYSPVPRAFASRPRRSGPPATVCARSRTSLFEPSAAAGSIHRQAGRRPQHRFEQEDVAATSIAGASAQSSRSGVPGRLLSQTSNAARSKSGAPHHRANHLCQPLAFAPGEHLSEAGALLRHRVEQASLIGDRQPRVARQELQQVGSMAGGVHPAFDRGRSHACRALGSSTRARRASSPSKSLWSRNGASLSSAASIDRLSALNERRSTESVPCSPIQAVRFPLHSYEQSSLLFRRQQALAVDPARRGAVGDLVAQHGIRRGQQLVHLDQELIGLRALRHRIVALRDRRPVLARPAVLGGGGKRRRHQEKRSGCAARHALCSHASAGESVLR